MFANLLALCLLPLLGSDNWYVRQASSSCLQSLTGIGSVLRLGIRSKDLETATRCRLLLDEQGPRWLVGTWWVNNDPTKTHYTFYTDGRGMKQGIGMNDEPIRWFIHPGDAVQVSHSPYFYYYFRREGAYLVGGAFGILEKE